LLKSVLFHVQHHVVVLIVFGNVHIYLLSKCSLQRLSVRKRRSSFTMHQPTQPLGRFNTNQSQSLHLNIFVIIIKIRGSAAGDFFKQATQIKNKNRCYYSILLVTFYCCRAPRFS
ncbi:MAG: hypothetical protein IIV21_04645, partial [Bacteroidales bacterium]|nr:hypothetical protein [Bacteroidales bacterium]